MENNVKKENIPEFTDSCPKIEILNSYFDKELSPESSEYKHISSCASCQEKLEFYSFLKKRLKKEISDSLPDNFTSDLKKTVRRRLKASRNVQRPIYFSRFFLRVASAAIVAGLGIVIFMTNTGTPGKSSIIKNKSRNALLSNSHKRLNLKLLNGNSPGGAISYKDFSQVSLNPDSRNLNSTPPVWVSATSEKKPVSIYPKVKQVWVASNMREAVSKLSSISKSLGIKKIEAWLSPSRKNLCISLSLTKKDLIRFVRLCAANGFDLITPSAPQPEQNIFKGSPEEQVEYSANFVLGQN